MLFNSAWNKWEGSKKLFPRYNQFNSDDGVSHHSSVPKSHYDYTLVTQLYCANAGRQNGWNGWTWTVAFSLSICPADDGRYVNAILTTPDEKGISTKSGSPLVGRAKENGEKGKRASTKVGKCRK